MDTCCSLYIYQMIKIMNIENASEKDILTRDIKLESGVESVVKEIIENVKANGDRALYDYAEKFDGVRPSSLVVSEEEIDSSFTKNSPKSIWQIWT